MSYKNINYGNMQVFSRELKAKYAKKSEVSAVAERVGTLERAGYQPNVIEGVKVNGQLLTLVEKIADILVAEGTTNGTVAVNNVDVAVHGLAALAFKAEVSVDDLAEALKNLINSKAAQSDLDTLTGTGDGSISKMIDTAINTFATQVSDDNVVNSFKELVDWAAEHGSEAAEMAGAISGNTTAITNLSKLVGELPQGATATTVVGYIAEAIAALSIGDYAKTSEVETMLSSYYTKTVADSTFVKTADIETVTEAEMVALLADDPEPQQGD